MMKIKRLLCMLCVFTVMLGCFTMSAGAAGGEEIMPMASGRFSTEIPGDTWFEASSPFPLEAGEKVRISATYTPHNANVEFGVIAPDGLFYSISCTTGSINRSITVKQTGNFTFAIANNSEEAIKVSGTITY